MSRREFQLVEGESRKFWAIDLDGVAHTVSYGRIGTAGQSQRKEFASAAEARASHDKLVAEKVKKGYAETKGAATAPAGEEKGAPAPAAPEPAGDGAGRKAKKAAAAPPEPATPAAEPAPAPLPTAVSIDLDPDDWLWATWRPRTPRPRPEPPPFDLEDCLDRLASVRRSAGARYHDDWSRAKLDSIVSPEEARFWIVALSEALSVRLRDRPPEKLMDAVRSQRETLSKPVTTKETAELIGRGYRPLRGGVSLLTPGNFLAVARDVWGLEEPLRRDSPDSVLAWFRGHILPYLDGPGHRAMQDEVRASLRKTSLPKSYPHRGSFPLAFYLAAALGLHEEVRDLVGSIPDGYYAGEEFGEAYHRPQLLILGLGSPVAVESEMRRLKLLLTAPHEIRGWLAHTEDRSLDLVKESILATANKEQCAELLDVLTLVKSPRASVPMLGLMLESRAPAAARRWLDEHPGHAIPGLIEVATGKGKPAAAAVDYFRAQRGKGHEGYIRECLAAAPPEAVEKLRREVLERADQAIPAHDDDTTPDWLRTACDGAKPLKPPGWVGPDQLPPILVAGKRLNPGQTKTALAALARSAPGAPHPLVAALKEHSDRGSLDAFAWALFECWLLEGGTAKEKWAMAALGLLGSDAIGLELARMVRAWPGENQHQRAVFGLECLRAIGTDAALMQLNGIAQKLKFKALQSKAAEMMEAIAGDRGLSRAELEDRIVPDCDLDERGGRDLDFGPRRFRFALGPEMKPMVRDEAGKLKDELPKPNAKDDATMAAAAVEAWKQLKKQVREVAKVQAERLEQAMVTGRRWTPGDLESLLVRHPLMINLVRLVLWGGYDERGKLVATFRVTEERDYADVDESPYRPDGLAAVGLVHPMHLTDEQRSAWGEIFGDYEIIPPFPQLGRTVHRLSPEEQQAREIVRNKGIKVPALALVGVLDGHGWVRGVPEDGGYFYEHSRPFEWANVTGVIQYGSTCGGIPITCMEAGEDQEVERCFFVPGIYTSKWNPEHKDLVPLGEVDPVVISEVLGTLGALASKGK